MKNKIYLIAGHNGSGTGANGFIDEGKETIILRDLIAKNLKEMGIIVIKDDNLTPLTKVVQWLRNQITKKIGIELKPLKSEIGDKVLVSSSDLFLEDLNVDLEPIPSENTQDSTKP